MLKTIAALMVVATVAGAQELPVTSLTTAERRALVAALKDVHPGSVVIACPGEFCGELADSIGRIFQSTGWTVDRNRSGPVVLRGIEVHACDLSESKVGSAIRAAFPARNARMIDEGRCAIQGPPVIFMVIGSED